VVVLIVLLIGNGDRLVDFCGVINLVIKDTLFAHKEVHKLTYISPN